MYPQGVCRIRKPAHAGNGCAIFPVFDTEERAEKIHSQPKAIYSEVPYIFTLGKYCSAKSTFSTWKDFPFR